MIEAGLEFANARLQEVLQALFALPADLRPSRYSRGEDEPATVIVELDEFLASTERKAPGPLLIAPRGTYDISIPEDKPLVCVCFLDVEPMLAKEFMLHMATAKPRFGFACAPEEREHRNRIKTKQGENLIESWVGRDLEQYIPGLYWLTLVPEVLAKKHDVPLSALKKIAREHIVVEDDQHLFRFYENPNDWKSTGDVARLCASLPGIFDIEQIRTQLMSAKTFLDLNALVRRWK